MAASTPAGVAAPSTLGQRVRAARHELGLSQAQLAGTELTKGSISQIESGLVRPSVRSLQMIAARLGKSLDYLLGDEPLGSTKRFAFHRLAAEAALEREDWTAMRAEVDAALQESPERRQRAKLVGLLAAADLAAGDSEAVFARISEALKTLDPSTDAHDVAQLLYWRGTAYGRLGQIAAAAESLEAARGLLERNEVIDTRLRPRLLVALATTYRRLNRTTKAMATYEDALGIATRASEFEMAARSHMGIAAALYDSGEYDSAITNYRRALDLWQRLSDSDFELNALQSLAGVYFEQGDYAKAREMASRCLVRAEGLGDTRWGAVARLELARLELREGRVTEALAFVVPAERALGELKDDQQRASAFRIMGAAYDAKGDYPLSDRAYRHAIQLVTGIEHLASRSVIAAEYAQKLRARGEIDRAFEMLDLARGAAAKR